MNRGRPTTPPSDRYPGWGISATDCIELSMVEPGSARACALLDQIERQLKECRTIDAIAGVRIVRRLAASSAQRRGTRLEAAA